MTTLTVTCRTCSATPETFPERMFWIWPHSDAPLASIFRPAGTGACSVCWADPTAELTRPLYEVLHEITPRDPRPILGPVRRSRWSADDFTCEHPSKSNHCSSCWLERFCYECGQPNEGNHASCFVAMSEIEHEEDAEDAHTAYCEVQPPHSVRKCTVYGYDYTDGIYLR